MKTLSTALFLLLGIAFATQEAALTTAPAHTYTCNGEKDITVTYLNYPDGGPSFAALNWNNQEYGLALAPSADGGRYASLYGPTPGGNGLEWWEAQGSATLSAFTSSDTDQTRVLLDNCKVTDTTP